LYKLLKKVYYYCIFCIYIFITETLIFKEGDIGTTFYIILFGILGIFLIKLLSCIFLFFFIENISYTLYQFLYNLKIIIIMNVKVFYLLTNNIIILLHINYIIFLTKYSLYYKL
jgi:hypothetical protein